MSRLKQKRQYILHQTPETKPLDRKDHVWIERDEDYKCGLCGAICLQPPPYPSPRDYTPDKYETLTDTERMLVR